MRILHVGASGHVGEAVGAALRDRGHDVVAAHRTSPEHPVDITDPDSVARLYEQVGPGLDGVVCTAGSTPYAPWDELGREQLLAGLNSKFLGQVEVVRQGVDFVREGGSFTLTSGILGREPVRTGSVAAAVNGALEAWVRASAGELWGRVRLNVVSSTVLSVSREAYMSVMPGYPAVDSGEVGLAYVRSVESMDSGRVYML
ncbi:MAG TPA: short chain dehydrogenase [Nocardioides sp.]|nr:short chain dehydrogenase [Nocardioides sp.]